MPIASKGRAGDLRSGDCVLLLVDKVERWCEVEDMVQSRPHEAVLRVIPQGDELHESLNLAVDPDDEMLVFRGRNEMPNLDVGF